jgi:hypothetical protein
MSQQVAFHEAEPEEIREAQSDRTEESVAPRNDPQLLRGGEADSTLARTWATVDQSAPPNPPPLEGLDAPAPLQSSDVPAARTAKLVTEIGLLFLLLCVIVGTCVAHYWMRLF